MNAKRAIWVAGGLAATLAVAPLALWTMFFVLSAEEALSVTRKLLLIALAAAVLAGGLAGLWRAVRASDPTMAARPLAIAALAVLVWAAAAPW